MASGDERAPDYEILGVSLFGPPPVGVVHFKWEPGLFVLYGRNGVGKTAILNGIRNALDWESRRRARHDREGSRRAGPDRGLRRPTGEWLHLRLVDPRTPILEDPGDFVWTFNYSLGVFLLGENANLEGRSILSVITDRLLDTDRLFGVPLESKVISELAGQACISIKDWSGVYASAVLSADTPHLNAHIQSLQRRARRFEDSGDQTNWHGYRLPGASVTINYPAACAFPFLTSPLEHWVPIPIARLDRGDGFFEAGEEPQVFVPSDQDPDELTNQVLLRRSWQHPILSSVEEDEGMLLEVPTGFTGYLEEIESRANLTYKGLLADAPKLRLVRTQPKDWFEGRVVYWEACDRQTGNWTPVTTLSTAQLRWANAAIQFALQESWQANRAMIVDGPEDALHPQALTHLMEELQATAQDFGPVFVASHSPQVLATAGAKLLHVQRDMDGLAKTSEMTPALKGDIESTAHGLGMGLSDLLQLFRVFLIVEGRHDSEVLQAVLGAEFAKAQVHMLHMSGTKNLSDVAGSELLLTFTDASIVVVLDHVRPHGVPKVWSEAQALAMDGNKKAAMRSLNEFEERNRRDLEREEAKALEFCRNAISTGRPDRFEIVGMSEPDIIRYLNPEHFVPGLTWDDLWREYQAYYRKTPGPKTFKSWLGARPDCKTKPKVGNLGPLARQDFADAIPEDFTELLATCRRLAGI